MKRRSFLAGLLAVSVAPALPIPVAADMDLRAALRQQIDALMAERAELLIRPPVVASAAMLDALELAPGGLAIVRDLNIRPVDHFELRPGPIG